MDAVSAHLKCLRNGLTVYPVIVPYTHTWKIRVDKNEKQLKVYPKVLRSAKEVNEALEKTIIFLAQKLESTI